MRVAGEGVLGCWPHPYLSVAALPLPIHTASLLLHLFVLDDDVFVIVVAVRSRVFARLVIAALSGVTRSKVNKATSQSGSASIQLILCLSLILSSRQKSDIFNSYHICRFGIFLIFSFYGRLLLGFIIYTSIKHA